MKSNPNRACLKRSTKPAARQGKQALRLHLRTRSLPSGGCSYKLVDVRTDQVFLLLVVERELPSLINVDKRRGFSLMADITIALAVQLPHTNHELKRAWEGRWVEDKPTARKGKQTLGLILRSRPLPSGGDCYQLVDVRTDQVVLLLVMERELPSLLKMAERRLKSLTGPLMGALILHYPRMEPEIKGQGRAAA